MKVFITGGTGFVGSMLTQRLLAEGHEVTVLTRSEAHTSHMPQGVRVVEGNPISRGPWQDKVSENDIIINLAGSSIFTRWTNKAKQALRESRLRTTDNLVEALAQGGTKVSLLMSASAVGYYGFHGDEELDEDSPPGEDFLAILARDWEQTAFRAEAYGTRVITCRFGIVLGKGGGALEKMVKPFRMGLGAQLGSGRQWFSWIHEWDLASAFLFLIKQPGISGPINFTSPEPVTNKMLTKVLSDVLNKPRLMPPLPGLILRMLMGEFGNVLIKGQKVLPKRLIALGFRYRFPNIREALADLMRR